MVLKHRDTEVLRFDWVTPFGVKNVELNASAAQFLPIAFRDRVLGKDVRELSFALENWLLHRTAPLSRSGIRDALCNLGFDPDEPQWKRQLLTFSRALSLNDVHWLAKDDSSEKWAEVNLYDNSFSTAVATMAFTGDRLDHVRDASTSPEYSTNGNLRKCWRRLNGEVLLCKAGAHPLGGFFEKPNAGGFEPFAEYYAAQVAAAMKLDHVPYGLAQFKYRLCSTCPLFTSDKYGFLPARYAMSGDDAVKDVRFAELFFFDAIVFNTDRHLGNFGFLIDNDTNELKGLAPIFDNGYSLFSQAISNPGHRGDEFKDLRIFIARKHPKLYDHWLDIPGGVTDELIDRLKGLEKFEFTPHPLFAMPNQRLEMSQYFLQKRIQKIIKYRGKADKYLNVRRKDVTISDTIPDKLLKKAEESMRLRADLKATLKSFPRAKTEKLAILYKTTTRTIARHIKALQEAGELVRVGSRKTGHWQVIEKAIGEERNG